MVTPLLNYKFDDIHVSNPDGSKGMTVSGARKTDGPGALAGSDYPDAIDLEQHGAGSVRISDLPVDTEQFHVRIVFRVPNQFQGRQNLVESNHLPFALYLQGQGHSGTRLAAAVRTEEHGWANASTRFSNDTVSVGDWHVADLVYDLDTLGLFLDEQFVSIHAFPDGEIDTMDGLRLYLGTWVDGHRNHFDGEVAALQFDAGVPSDLEARLDEHRDDAEWFITHKANLRMSDVNLGQPNEAPKFDDRTGAYLQRWSRGAFMYHPAAGAAFEMHGSIYSRYKSMSDADELGYLVTDEVEATDESGRKSLFSNGGIYWSPSTGAHALTGRLYTEYEAQGESDRWGFPTREMGRVAGATGTEIKLQRARMYHHDGDPAAFEVHGAILQQFLSTGGVDVWGFPVTNEMATAIEDGWDLTGSGDNEIPIRTSEFQNGVIHWSSRTGAHGIRNPEIRRVYEELGGPTGAIGLPVSNEMEIQGADVAGRTAGFEEGTLCWYDTGDDDGEVRSVRPFEIHVGTLDTDESEGWLMEQNDLYFRATVTQGGTRIHRRKYPNRGDWSDRNVRDVNVTLPVMVDPIPGETVTVEIDLWDSDDGAPFGGGDDHLGDWTIELDERNAWGLTENNGVFDSGDFQKVNNVRLSVKPQVELATFAPEELFWTTGNPGTDDLTRSQYAQAFRDVDSETEWWDIDDGLDSLYYELVVKDIAEGGNCFGMSLEAIYARKGASPFAPALMDDYDWNTIRPTINVKQAYQVGAAPIWWFVGMFLTGTTHHPRRVFELTRFAHDLGMDPVLSVSQNYDFSGSPHTILPVAWDDNDDNLWTITVLDPNFPDETKTVEIDPDRLNSSFEYEGSVTYSGEEWTGGRMHFMPYAVLNSAPESPLWDALSLLLGGTVLILGDDAETESITDANGTDLDAHGEAATGKLQNGERLEGHFVSYPGFDGQGTVTGELLATYDDTTYDPEHDEPELQPMILDKPVFELPTIGSTGTVREDVIDLPSADSTGRLPGLAADPRVTDLLSEAARDALENLITTSRPGDFVHEATGKRHGRLKHAVKHGLGHVLLETETTAGEQTEVAGKDLGTSNAAYRVTTERDRDLNISLSQHLGVAGERIETLLRIPAKAGHEVAVHPRPGLGAIDLIIDGDPVDASVSLVSKSKESQRKRHFDVHVDGGARLTLSQGLERDVLKVSQVDRAHGAPRNSEIVRRS